MEKAGADEAACHFRYLNFYYVLKNLIDKGKIGYGVCAGIKVILSVCARL
ncbi:MAG: hypothetical protein NC419_00670 [Muribaculaceae bacterium]|nr:hypothetical protein [Muribaculaceae bacterium]